MLVRFIPTVFVVLWASGFVGAKIGLQYAEPATLLTLRMLANLGVFTLLVVIMRSTIPKGKMFCHSFIVGLLIHGFYLGGTYIAIDLGMPSGLSALLVGIQPILTAIIFVTYTREHLKLSQWFGLTLGFVGISLVLMGKTQWQDDSHKFIAVGLCLVSLLGITLGTLYQKRFCSGVDKIGSALIHYFAALCLFFPYAMNFETMSVNWTLEFTLTLFWLVIVLSVVAIMLLLFMVERGASEKVASIFYLVPPVTGIQAWLIFGESFDRTAIVGFILSATAVFLITRTKNTDCQKI
ncbi:DMT family transporter [Vibrio tetraodonis]|uniref:DMT family transporter n=1 Tax=Vibrio tetraodonis TaxID=2231647 RepID=UPI000E0C1795|nr:DMT family transporter [Vibrio tetraodonis]